MFNSNKILTLLLIGLLFFSFSYGFVSHRNKLFPYQLIKNIHNSLTHKSSGMQEDDLIRSKYKNWNDLNENFEPIKEVFLKKYYPGINIYSDRNYFNHKNDNKLSGFSIIQIPKHYSVNVKLSTSHSVYVYRALCKHNNNDAYDNWEKVDFEILTISHTCIHKKIVRKKFEKGEISLNPGGPKSSDPIFIFFLEKNTNLEYINLSGELFLVDLNKLK